MLPGLTAARPSFDSTTDSALIAELLARECADEPRSDGRDLEHALRAGAAASSRGGVLARADGRSAPHRRARPARLLAARARPDRGRLGARQRDRRARHRRRALRPRRRAGRDGRDRRVGRALEPLRRSRPEALPLRVRLLRPSRHAALRPQRARGAPAHGRGARPPGAGRRRHGDAGARVGRPRRAGLRARVGHPLRRRPREEPLRRPHVHPAEPEEARRRACGSSSTRCRENIKGKQLVVVDDSIVRGTTTRQIDRRCCARPARPRCTSGCRRRRTGGRASTAWTPASVPSCSRPTCRSARSATTSASTRSRTSSSTGSSPRPARRPSRSAPRASPASTRCRCPTTTRSSRSSAERRDAHRSDAARARVTERTTTPTTNGSPTPTRASTSRRARRPSS